MPTRAERLIATLAAISSRIESLPPAFGVITLVIGVAAVPLALQESGLFTPYFGAVQPAVALAIVAASGWPALLILDSRAGFPLSRPAARRRGLFAAAALALPFMAAVTLADLALGFDAGINVALPAALLFYPVMGYVAALLLHAVPLALLLALVARLRPSWPEGRRVRLCIVLVAGIEAAFQWRFTGGSAALGVFVVAELYMFGLVELWLFRRYDFVTMFAFRMIYYGYWHIVWGTLRQQWIF